MQSACVLARAPGRPPLPGLTTYPSSRFASENVL